MNSVSRWDTHRNRAPERFSIPEKQRPARVDAAPVREGYGRAAIRLTRRTQEPSELACHLDVFVQSVRAAVGICATRPLCAKPILPDIAACRKWYIGSPFPLTQLSEGVLNCPLWKAGPNELFPRGSISTRQRTFFILFAVLSALAC